MAAYQGGLVALTMGEPAGIGGEIALKAWSWRAAERLPPFFMLDVFRFFRDTIPDVSDAVWTWKRLRLSSRPRRRR